MGSHLVCIRVRKGEWNVITEIVRNEMLEGRRESHTWCQGDSVVEIPELIAVIVHQLLGI